MKSLIPSPTLLEHGIFIAEDRYGVNDKNPNKEHLP